MAKDQPLPNASVIVISRFCAGDQNDLNLGVGLLALVISASRFKSFIKRWTGNRP